MARYLDTGPGSADQFIGYWLNQNVLPGIRGFRGQFGYFRYAALAPFARILNVAAAAGDPVHLVLGSNSGSLVAADVQRLLRIVSGLDASLTIVAYSGAEFHPKTIQVVRADGSKTAIVGSSNLTANGIGLNVEASVALDTNEGDDAELLEAIANATDRWRNLDEDGVFHIETDADIQSLVDARIINVPQPSKLAAPAAPRRRTGTNLGRRSRGWTPRGGAVPEIAALIPSPPAMPQPPAPVPVVVAAVVNNPHAAVVRQWCKRMRNSDAQHVPTGTNPKGMVTLTNARFPNIDFRSFFRADFFGNVAWQRDPAKSATYEFCHIPFDVRWHGVSRGQVTLLVDHDPERDYGQGNAYTWLHWGPFQADLLRQNHVGEWLVIARNPAGRFSMSVQHNAPAWAP